MDVFEAFPNGIVRDTWELGEVQRATEIGTVYQSVATCDVIVEEETEDYSGRTPDADYQESGTLIYARPEDMPTLNSAVLAADYYWHNKVTDQYYAIRKCALGTNQETGAVEHVEFYVKPTEVASA